MRAERKATAESLKRQLKRAESRRRKTLQRYFQASESYFGIPTRYSTNTQEGNLTVCKDISRYHHQFTALNFQFGVHKLSCVWDIEALDGEVKLRILDWYSLIFQAVPSVSTKLFCPQALSLANETVP